MPSTQIYQDSTILFIYALTSHVYWNILKQLSDFFSLLSALVYDSNMYGI